MHKLDTSTDPTVAPTYAGRAFDHPIPKFELPDDGLAAATAYQLVHDELNLDGNPALNLASFVTSWMEPEADLLARETIAKNMIDEAEYPQTQEVHKRVVTMLGHMFNVPKDCNPVGTATIGSSEAIMLALLAHKRTWQHRRKQAGLPADRPNVVMGADVHTCWEKFARYFEVEPLVAPMRAPDSFTLTADDVGRLVDERTIAVGGVLGSTFTGQMDELEDINNVLAGLERERDWKVPLHIDAASGGFIVPFSQPKLAWDFRLSHVRSINVSNHKFGLVYPGMGTVVFRDQTDLPEELIFHINYLGGDMPNYSLNFSRPSASVVLQYYSFLRLGRSGYQRVVANCLDNAQALGEQLAGFPELELINDGSVFPIVAAHTTTPERLDLTKVSEHLRRRGWIVPAYTLPPDAQHITVLRMVVKENFSRDMVDILATDIRGAIDDLGAATGVKAGRRPIC